MSDPADAQLKQESKSRQIFLKFPPKSEKRQKCRVDLLLADIYEEGTWSNSVPGWHILLRGYFQTSNKKRIKIFPPWIWSSLPSCNTFAVLARLETASGQNVPTRNRTETEVSANRYNLITEKRVISLAVSLWQTQRAMHPEGEFINPGLNFWHLLHCWASALLRANTGCLIHFGFVPCEFTKPVVPTGSFWAAHSELFQTQPPGWAGYTASSAAGISTSHCCRWSELKPLCVLSPASSCSAMSHLCRSCLFSHLWIRLSSPPAPQGMLYVFRGLQPHGEFRLPRTCRVRNLGHPCVQLMKRKGATLGLEAAALLWKGTTQKDGCSFPTWQWQQAGTHSPLRLPILICSHTLSFFN